MITLSGSPAGWQTIRSGSDCLSLRAFRWLLIPVPSICHWRRWYANLTDEKVHGGVT